MKAKIEDWMHMKITYKKQIKWNEMSKNKTQQEKEEKKSNEWVERVSERTVSKRAMNEI